MSQIGIPNLSGTFSSQQKLLIFANVISFSVNISAIFSRSQDIVEKSQNKKYFKLYHLPYLMIRELYHRKEIYERITDF
uniref:Uncharacterized protein n=1 Tax=Siphoviridae sp. ctbQZ1 TaxID=2827581 RepID=A0A8S5LN86_9CAUD|nr:MAG TPA: hypothetical protein [Siphoviridae sp. ctbQZ1]